MQECLHKKNRRNFYMSPTKEKCNSGLVTRTVQQRASMIVPWIRSVKLNPYTVWHYIHVCEGKELRRDHFLVDRKRRLLMFEDLSLVDSALKLSTLSGKRFTNPQTVKGTDDVPLAIECIRKENCLRLSEDAYEGLAFLIDALTEMKSIQSIRVSNILTETLCAYMETRSLLAINRTNTLEHVYSGVGMVMAHARMLRV
jgi:hypothetical protein